MKKHDAVCIGDIYGKMLNSLRHTLKESAPKTFDGEKVELVGDGPNVSGYNEVDGEYTGKKGTKKNNGKRLKPTKAVHEEAEETEDAPKTKRQQTTEKMRERLKDPKLSTEQKARIKREIDEREYEGEENIAESKKIITNTLNNFMSKSVFDKLYSKVLRENFGQDGDDTDALGLGDATPDSDLEDGFGGEDDFGAEDEGDSVTFTLPKDVAQQLIDVLQASLGGEEEGAMEDEGDDLDFGDEGEDDFGGEDEFGAEEDEEVQGTKVAPDKKKVFQAKSNQVAGPPKPKHVKAKSDVTDEVGTKDGAPPIAALQGKSNQVPSSVKVGDYFK